MTIHSVELHEESGFLQASILQPTARNAWSLPEAEAFFGADMGRTKGSCESSSHGGSCRRTMQNAWRKLPTVPKGSQFYTVPPSVSTPVSTLSGHPKVPVFNWGKPTAG